MRRHRVRGTHKTALVRKYQRPVTIFMALVTVFARKHKLAPKAVIDALSKKQPDYAPGQWHRWYKVNRRRQRQISAIKQLCGAKINPNLTGLPRMFVR